jgi:excisionase family DNA binding protein
VREITESLVEGVYLFLGKIRRTGDYAFYIGQTINAVGRFVAHRRSFESRLIRINSSRMFMLNEIRGESERLNSESRFIAAAQQLKLPLFNLKLPNLCVHSRNLDSEKQILREALKTLGISPDQMSRRRNRLREAATFSPTEFECARAAEYCDADRKEIERAVREGRLRAVRIGRNAIIKRTHLDTFLANLPPYVPSPVSSCPQVLQSRAPREQDQIIATTEPSRPEVAAQVSD